MRMLVVVAVVLVGFGAGSARADSVWDRKYKHDMWNGQWPCPDAQHDIVVADGKFSIAWDIKVDDEPVTIAHIDGSVRPSGMTENTVVKFIAPFPAKAKKALEDDSDSLDELLHRAVKVKFEGDGSHTREIIVTAEQGQCYARWTEDRKAVTAAAASGAVDCTAKPYDVPVWSATKSYKVGDYTRVQKAGQPVRLYRCVDACKAGVVPSGGGSRGGGDEDDDDDGNDGQQWSFYGECAGGVKSEVVLPAAGAPKWDTTYKFTSHFTQDWRCPHDVAAVTVAKGKFSIPWKLASEGGDGRERDAVPVGAIEGVIAADGTVALRAKFSVTTVPPEVTEHLHLTGEGAMAKLRLAEPAMTFILDVGKKNPAGQGRRASLKVAGGQCEYELAAKDYQPQQFREEDGWRVDCNPDAGWDAKATYRSGDEATVASGGARHKYTCKGSPHCDVGSRPGSSAQWTGAGRCK